MYTPFYLIDSGKPMSEILRVVDSKIPSVNQFFYGLMHLIQDSRINYPEIAENTSKNNTRTQIDRR